MERRPLGDSGLAVSILGLGTAAMGGNLETWGHVDDRESIAAIHQALDAGINLIETAPSYGRGHSEEIVGRAIQGRREEVLIATQCGLSNPRSGDGRPQRCLSPDIIKEACEHSLRRLRVETIDLYLCHLPDPETRLRETMEALAGLRGQGKLRAIGLSNIGWEQVAAAREFGPIHAVQAPFSVLNRRAADDLVPYCAEHGIAALPCSPLGKGLLTGKFNRDSVFEDLRARDPAFIGRRYRDNLDLVSKLTGLADEMGLTVAQLAIQWIIGRAGVTAAIVGAKRPSQVIENVGGVAFPLDSKQRARIDGLLEGR